MHVVLKSVPSSTLVIKSKLLIADMGKPEEAEENEEGQVKARSRTATDIQRKKLERLMKNPDKPAHIPEQRKEKDPNKAPEFVYNVMGSSAGAGSGEFHVYRNIRRKESMRQNVIQGQRVRDELNDAYHIKLAENEKEAQDRTDKKRNKRQKKKDAAKKRKLEQKKNKGKAEKKESESSESSESESENEEEKS